MLYTEYFTAYTTVNVVAYWDIRLVYNDMKYTNWLMCS